MSRERARISILSELLGFPTVRQTDWLVSISNKPQVGNLVSLNCCPETKWYVSWVREIDESNPNWPRYLLESIDDGELCWWANVGLNIYNPERVSERPTWFWDDKQFAFNDRWTKVCRRNDAYIILPMLPVFDEDKVTLNVRVRHGISEFDNPQTFDNWKKLTMKNMESYYLDCVEKYNNRPKAA